MKTEWVEYLESIGVKGPFLKRVEEVLDFYVKVHPAEIQDIFVTEYMDKDGNRQYESVWFFSEASMMEAKQFLKEDDFDSAAAGKQVQYWRIKKEEYDFKQASAKSRMMLDFSLSSRVSGQLKASQENCDHLKSIFLKHVAPNAKESPGVAQEVGRASLAEDLEGLPAFEERTAEPNPSLERVARELRRPGNR